MRRPRDHLEFFLTRQPRVSVTVQIQHRFVPFAHDQKNGRLDVFEGIARQVRPAAARNNGVNCRTDFRRRNQSGRAARARPEVTDSQPARFRLIGHPARCFDEPLGEQTDVETQASGQFVFGFFLFCEEVEQQRGGARLANGARDELVARTASAAAASVGEQHDAHRLRRHRQVAFQRQDLGGSVSFVGRQSDSNLNQPRLILRALFCLFHAPPPRCSPNSVAVNRLLPVSKRLSAQPDLSSLASPKCRCPSCCRNNKPSGNLYTRLRTRLSLDALRAARAVDPPAGAFPGVWVVEARRSWFARQEALNSSARRITRSTTSARAGSGAGVTAAGSGGMSSSSRRRNTRSKARSSSRKKRLPRIRAKVHPSRSRTAWRSMSSWTFSAP